MQFFCSKGVLFQIFCMSTLKNLGNNITQYIYVYNFLKIKNLEIYSFFYQLTP